MRDEGWKLALFVALKIEDIGGTQHSFLTGNITAVFSQGTIKMFVLLVEKTVLLSLLLLE